MHLLVLTATSTPATAATAPVVAQAAPAASQAQGSGSTAKFFKGYALTELTAAGLLYNPQAKATYYMQNKKEEARALQAKLSDPEQENLMLAALEVVGKCTPGLALQRP